MTVGATEAVPEQVSIQVNVRLPAETRQRLERVARITDRPVSQLVRYAVDAWLDAHEPLVDQALESGRAAVLPLVAPVRRPGGPGVGSGAPPGR